VKKGKSARGAVDKARGKAKAEERGIYEEVMLRIDCGTDVAELELGKDKLIAFNIDSSEWTHETSQNGVKCVKIKIVINATNSTDEELKVVFKKATLHTLKDKPLDMPVITVEKKPFERAMPSRLTKQIEYGNVITSKWDKGTRAIVVFHFAVGDESGALRTAAMVLK
jgi:hypothetical protein